MISELKPGDQFVNYFILRKIEIKTKRDSDEIYLSLELGDASGRIGGTVWDDVEKIHADLTVGEVVKVQAKVVNFKERLHLTVEKIRLAQDGDPYDLSQLVPVTEKDRDEMLTRLDQLVESVRDPDLNNLLHLIFDDSEIRAAFRNVPAGKLWHHNYLGGLLEHTLSVTEISDNIGQMYPHINRNLLVAGGLLHDIGKIRTYTYRTLFDYTNEGRLVGHIVIGAQLVAEKIKSLPEFPRKLETELMHLILSHQGKLEQASPVVPMTLEALILYYADELDSKANAILRITKKEKRPGVLWSSFVKMMDRYLYFGSSEE